MLLDQDPTLEQLAEAAGMNVVQAKADIAKLRAAFGERIPDAALNRWVDAYQGAARELLASLGRHWESECH